MDGFSLEEETIIYKGCRFSMSKVSYLRFHNAVVTDGIIYVLGEYEADEPRPLMTMDDTVVPLPNLPSSGQYTFVFAINPNPICRFGIATLSSDGGSVRCYSIINPSVGSGPAVLVAGSRAEDGSISGLVAALKKTRQEEEQLELKLQLEWEWICTYPEYQVIQDIATQEGHYYGCATTVNEMEDQEFYILRFESTKDGQLSVASSKLMAVNLSQHYLVSRYQLLYYITTTFNPPNTKIYLIGKDGDLDLDLVDNVPYSTHSISSASILTLIMNSSAILTVSDSKLTHITTAAKLDREIQAAPTTPTPTTATTPPTATGHITRSVSVRVTLGGGKRRPKPSH